MTENAMTELLATLTEFFTWCITQMTALFGQITGEPILFIIVFGFLIVGFIFGLVNRLIRIG